MLTLSLNLAFGLYFLTFGAGLVVRVMLKSEKPQWVLWPLVLAWLLHTLHIILRWMAAGRPPLSNQYESMLFLVWASVGIFLVFLISARPLLTRIILWIALAAALTLAAASLLDRSIRPLVPALQSNWLIVHVTTVMLGYASFLLAFIGGLLLLTLKTDLDLFNYRMLALGFWLLTLGIITGSIWANTAWGSYWSWDPKETWSLITWFFYAIALHLRRTRQFTGQRFAWLCILGFLFVLFTYFGVNYLLAGLHSYAS
jgi:ABC-type transport system involved in cytochrome c biogenesis permease subunit